MTLDRILTTDVVTVEVDTPVADVGTAMRDHNVGSVVVVDDGRPRGIVTDRDLVLYAMDDDPTTLTARNVMAEDLFTVDVHSDVFSVINRMYEHRVRRVPVLDDGRLVGIVTLDDFVRLLSAELEKLAALIEAESPRH